MSKYLQIDADPPPRERFGNTASAVGWACGFFCTPVTWATIEAVRGFPSGGAAAVCGLCCLLAAAAPTMPLTVAATESVLETHRGRRWQWPIWRTAFAASWCFGMVWFWAFCGLGFLLISQIA
ncbi:MAG: hypothetical protein AAF907_06270 [Planctomycetota bacterium]